MRQRSRPAIPDDARVIDDLLKFGSRRTALSCRQECLSANIVWIEAGNVNVEQNLPSFNRGSGRYDAQGLDRIFLSSATAARSTATRENTSAYPRGSVAQGPAHRLGSRPVARHRKRQRDSSPPPDSRERASEHRPRPAVSSAKCPYAASAIAVFACHDSPCSLWSTPNGGVNRSPRQLAFAQMADVSFGVRGERQADHSHAAACPQTTVAAPPSPPSPTRETPAHREKS